MDNQISWNDVKNEILASANWIVQLDDYDLLKLEQYNDKCVHVIESLTNEQSDKRFAILSHLIKNEISDRNIKIASMIVILQFPISHPIMMAEMKSIDKLIDDIAGDDMSCEIKWGISPREDNKSRIVCAFYSVI